MAHTGHFGLGVMVSWRRRRTADREWTIISGSGDVDLLRCSPQWSRTTGPRHSRLGGITAPDWCSAVRCLWSARLAQRGAPRRSAFTQLRGNQAGPHGRPIQVLRVWAPTVQKTA